LVVIGVLVVAVRKRPASAVQTLVKETFPAVATGPVLPLLGLRVVGTAMLYQADAQATVIRVGRQKRRPGESQQLGNDLVIRTPANDDSLKISRQHFRIERTADAITIVDASSAGTWINDTRLVKGETSPLKAGDVIGVANVLRLEVFLFSDRPACKIINSAEIPAAAGSPSLIMEASLGDMVTTE